MLGLPRHQVTVECLRMGGAFGGKEVQANAWAAIAALGAWKTGRPVRVRLPRQLDMALTGKRHPFLARYSTPGFDDDGRLQGARVSPLLRRRLEPRSLRAGARGARMFHCDNAYYIPALEVDGLRLPDAQDLADGVPRLRRTAGHAGDRGDSGSRRAHASALPPDVVRERNFYRDGAHDALRAAGARTPRASNASGTS